MLPSLETQSSATGLAGRLAPSAGPNHHMLLPSGPSLSGPLSRAGLKGAKAALAPDPGHGHGTQDVLRVLNLPHRATSHSTQAQKHRELVSAVMGPSEGGVPGGEEDRPDGGLSGASAET